MNIWYDYQHCTSTGDEHYVVIHNFEHHLPNVDSHKHVINIQVLYQSILIEYRAICQIIRYESISSVIIIAFIAYCCNDTKSIIVSLISNNTKW